MAMRVERLTLSGQGQLVDGTVVDRVLPGEEVELVEGATPRIITPSTDRVKPPCRHFKSCGGCVLQHAADAFVATWKQAVVERALTARSLSSAIRSVHTSPVASRRRAKFSGRRTKKGAMIGFHAKGSDVLVETPDCQLIDADLKAGFPALEALTVLAASRKSEVQLTTTLTEGGMDVGVTTEKDLTGPLRITLAGLAEEHNLARLAWNDEVVVTRIPPEVTFGKAKVAPPSGSFLQATREGEAALVAAVIGGVSGAGRIVDLFSGAGTFSLPLAEQAMVHAVEGDADMLGTLERGWRHATGLKAVTTEARDLFRRPLEPDELNKFEAAVLDPPRAGAEAQIRTIAASDLKTIVMVSCNPVTFARDAQTLCEAGFVLNWVDVVDQFRWSTHVELVGGFTRS